LASGFSAARRHPRAESARGLAQSKTLARWPEALEGREAAWSAAVPSLYYSQLFLILCLYNKDLCIL
jgi:hypothetical protein